MLAEHALDVFASLQALTPMFSDAFDTLTFAVPRLQGSVTKEINSPLSQTLDRLETVREAARHCFLKAVREARVLSMVFKHFDGDAEHVVKECVPGSLASVEHLALTEARAEDDENSETPFDLG